MQFRSYNSLFLRFAVSSSISVINPSPPRPAISVLFASYSTSSSSYNQFNSRRIQNEEDSRNVRVSVWWDFENCHLPAGENVFKLAQTITSAIRINGIKGPISITAFGDLVQLSRTNQEALFETGINLTHVPQGGKNSTDRSLITDLMYWVSQNPPPAHLFLISSDRDFASMLHRLRMKNYNILLAGKEESTPSVLCSAATIMWDWEALVRGKSSTGKHFNQPPDGPYNSWYGHYTTPLLDPFATTKQQSCTTDSKEVVKQISLIMRCYPKGVPITELRDQLIKRSVWLDRDFYGHKNFSSFLLSMPKILQVVPVGDGVFLIHSVAQGMDNKAPLPKLSSENPKVVSVEKICQKMNQNDEDVKVESQSQVSSQNSVLVINQMDVKSRDEFVKETQRALVAGDDVSSSKEKDGLFKKLTRKWFGSPDKDLESRIASSTSNESAMEVKANTQISNEKSKSPEILSRLLKRYKFSWGRNTKLGNARATGPPLVDEFSKKSFWNDLKSFNKSPRGFVVSYSRSREAMAKNLKEEGLSSSKPLVLSKMLDLLSLLISEKKWTKESSCDALPLSIAQFTEKSSGHTNPCSSVELKPVLVNTVKSQSDEASGEYKSKNIALKPIERSRSEVIADCHRLIKKITEENPGGYNMGKFRKDFRERIGYPLDICNLGYSKLQSFIQTMPEVKIESGHIVPSSMHESDSSFENVLGPVSGKIHQYESSDSITNEDACLKQYRDDVEKTQKDNEKKSELLEILGDFDKKQENLEEDNVESDTNKEACLKLRSDNKKKKQKDNEIKSELLQSLGDFDKKQKKLEEEDFDSDTNEEACLKQSSEDEKKKQKDNEAKSELLQILGDFDKKQKTNLEEENFDLDTNEEACSKESSGNEKKKQSETTSQLICILGDFHKKQKKPAKTLGDGKIVEGILTTLRKTSSSESKIQD